MILASFQVRCDWCHHCCSPAGLEGYQPVERWDTAIDAVLAAAVSPDRPRPAVDVGGPPGHPLHLCAACAGRGRPPVRLPAKTTKKRRKPAGQGQPSTPDRAPVMTSTAPPCATMPSLFDHQEVGTAP